MVHGMCISAKHVFFFSLTSEIQDYVPDTFAFKQHSFKNAASYLCEVHDYSLILSLDHSTITIIIIGQATPYKTIL